MGDAKRRQDLGLYPSGNGRTLKLGPYPDGKGNFIIPGTRGLVHPTLKQVSNLPLMAVDVPNKLVEIKGCVFSPGIFLERGKFYLMIIKTGPWRPNPPAAFYHVPQKQRVIYCKGFRFLEVSYPNLAGLRAWLWEAVEGQPENLDWIPTMFGKSVTPEL